MSNNIPQLALGELVTFTDGEFKGLQGKVIESYWEKVSIIKIINSNKIDTIRIANKVENND